MDKEIKYNVSEKIVIYSIAVLVGALISFFALLLFAALCLYLDLQENYSFFVSGVCLAIGGFNSGFLSSKKLKKKGILNGFVCGMFLYLIVLIISLFFRESGVTSNTLYRFLLTIIASMMGGVIGVNFKSKRKYI